MVVKTRSKKRIRMDKDTQRPPNVDQELSSDSSNYSKSDEDIEDKSPKRRNLPKKAPYLENYTWSAKTERSQSIKVNTASKKLSKYFIALMVVCISFVFGTITSKTAQNVHEEDSLDKFKELLENLRSSFIDQDEEIWKIILSSIQPVMEHRGKGPSVLMLVTTPGARNLSSCLAMNLADSITKAQGYPAVQHSLTYDNQNEEKIDELIDNMVKETSSIIIENLETFPYDSFKLLQGYCDDQNPPYKIAFFILTLNCDEPYNNNKFDTYATTKLRNIWQVSSDLLEPIITRITRSVVVVRNGTLPNICKKSLL